ncbi:MAG: TlpA family protein disulfide reductase [Candidatus Kapabacteria bacterium]|nr:TlpA family protein disulfide reductase [Candidatus Kapabacteria bacterium]
MKKSLKFSILLIVLLSIHSSLFSGTVTLSPEFPTKNESMLVSYRPTGSFLPKEQLYAQIYTMPDIGSLLPVLEIPLEFSDKGNVYTASFQIPTNAVFGMVKISNRTKDDNNNGAYWDFMVYSNDQKPLQSAYMRKGMSYLGNLPEECRRATDFVKVQEILSKEVELYPSNFQALIAFHSMRLTNKQITQDQFKQILTDNLAKGFDKENENSTRVAIRAFKMLNRVPEANSLEAEFVKKYPSSELAQEIALSNLSSIQDKDQFVKAARAFVTQFPNEFNTESVVDALVQTLLNAGQFQEAKEFVLNLQSIPPKVQSQIAEWLAAQDSTLEMGVEWSNVAIANAEKGLNMKKPIYLTEYEWLNSQDKLLGVLYATNGSIYFKNSNFKESKNSLNKAFSYLKETSNSDLFEMLILVNIELKDSAAAYEVSKEAIKAAKVNPRITEHHKKLFTAVNKNEKGYQAEFDKLKDESSKVRRSFIAEQKLNATAPTGSVKTLDGKTITLESLKGKVVLLDFWATWCGPCRSSFGTFQKLYEKYKNNPNVVIMAVNVWERSQNRKKTVVDFFKENNQYSFPVYMDEQDELVKKFGATGIPAKYYLDKKGNLQFTESGFEGPEQFFEGASDKIEILLAN